MIIEDGATNSIIITAIASEFNGEWRRPRNKPIPDMVAITTARITEGTIPSIMANTHSTAIDITILVRRRPQILSGTESMKLWQELFPHANRLSTINAQYLLSHNHLADPDR